jgi:hypothetical protein
MSDVSLNLITRGVLKYFRFLLDKGFVITRSSDFLRSLGSWFIEFEASNCFLIVLSDRDEVVVRFYPVKSNRKIVIALQPMIFYLTGGKTFISNYEGNLAWSKRQQLERTSNLLKEYIDQIILYMGDKFLHIENNVMLAGDQYMKIQRASYRQERR